MASIGMQIYEENRTVINLIDVAMYLLAILFFSVGCREKPPKNTTFLHKAVWSGDIEKTKSLITKGADVKAKDTDGDTPLHNAVFKGHKKVVNVLLKHGANLEAKDRGNRTPLDEAVRGGHNEIIELLKKMENKL